MCKYSAACAMLFTAVGGSSFDTTLTSLGNGVRHTPCQALPHALSCLLVVLCATHQQLATVCAVARLAALQGSSLPIYCRLVSENSVMKGVCVSNVIGMRSDDFVCRKRAVPMAAVLSMKHHHKRT